MTKNWKTTVLGIATVVTALSTAVKAFVDGDPSTNPDWMAVITAFTAGFGLIFAKDHDVTGGTVPQ